MDDLTRRLDAVQRGDPQAAAELLPLVYAELRQLAAAKLAHEKPGQTLDATALVHEAYLRLVREPDAQARASWNGRGHFFAAAAEAMRRILVEQARRKGRLKRGGGGRREDLDASRLVAPLVADDILALDEALHQLAEQDPLAARLVDLRYFAGLTAAQAAEALDLAPRTADRIWTYARSWLFKKIAGG